MRRDAAPNVVLYNELFARFQEFREVSVNDLSNAMMQRLDESFPQHKPIEKLGLMLEYLNQRIGELDAMRNQKPSCRLIRDLRAYETHLISARNAPMLLLDEDIKRATLLTFTIAVRAKTLNPGPNQAEVGLSTPNTKVGNYFAKQLRGDEQAEISYQFNGWRFLAGLALFILGAGLAVGAACSIGVFFGATTPFAVAVAKYGLEMAAVSALYLFSTLVVACSKGRVKIAAPAFVSVAGGLAAGAAADVAGAIPATASLNSGIAGTAMTLSGSWGPAVLFSSLAISATAALAALASGGYLMWSSRTAGKTLAQQSRYETICSTAERVLRVRR